MSAKDIEWAEQIFVMDREQKQWIAETFRDHSLPPIQILDIPDEYEYMDSRLQNALRQAIDPELNALWESRTPRPGS